MANLLYNDTYKMSDFRRFCNTIREACDDKKTKIDADYLISFADKLDERAGVKMVLSIANKLTELKDVKKELVDLKQAVASAENKIVFKSQNTN